MPAEILDGRKLADEIRRQVAADVAALVAETGIVPGLAVILVGDDPASHVYVRNKERACQAAGMNGKVVRLPSATTEAELLAEIDRLNRDAATHGILVQMPLPKQISEAAAVERVAPAKDVDGFHPVNFGLLAAGRPRFIPCTPLGIRELLLHSGVETRGVCAVVLGRSQIVGKPMALLLLQKGPGGDATVTVCHTATRDPAAGSPGRPVNCSRRQARAGHRRLGQARRRRHRRGYSQASGRWPVRRRSFRERVPGGSADHTRARGRWTAHHRGALAQYRDGSTPVRRLAAGVSGEW